MTKSLWLLLLFSSLAQAAGKSVLLNGTAVAVGKVLITVRDAQFFNALQRLRDDKLPGAPLQDREELRQVVQKMAVEEMVAQEMKSFQVGEESRGEAEKLVQSLKGKGRWKELLSLYGKSERSAVDIFWKSSRVERFLQRKVETLTPLVTEAEAATYFKQNQAKFYGSSFEALKPTIISALRKEQMEKGLEEWIRSLREKHGLINLLPE